jgi:hypothetical protein
MEKKLVLENDQNIVTRTFHWDGQLAYVICREDTRRVELHTDLAQLDSDHIYYRQLAVVDPQTIEKQPVSIEGRAQLRLVDKVDTVFVTPEKREDNKKLIYWMMLLVLLLNGAFLLTIFTRPIEEAKLEDEAKQRIVQIVKKMPPKEVVKPNIVTKDTATVKANTKKRFDGIKRLGALAVLGSLSNSKQKGGLNLNAVNTTAGPGLGGTGGSGGVQTSIYAKGITSAPLGAGANMAGGGGYGTKGKGGGQAGYGKLSMVGSAGNMPIPLGKEALIDGGLDMDAVSEVIRRNMGQVRFCYEQGLQQDPSLAGRVGMDFTIGANGQVKVAHVGTTTLNSKQIEECVLLRLKSWKFPLPSGGVDVKVSYPFLFNRTGNG